MFEGLLNFLMQVREWLMPWTVVQCYERGVLLRFGKPIKDLKPGFHWVIPFGVDDAITETTVPNSCHLRTQSLTTRDDQPVNVSVMCIYQIKNVRKFLLEVEGRGSFLSDCVYSAVAEHVQSTDRIDLTKEAQLETMYKKARAQGFRYGVEIQKLTFVDACRGKSMRLWQTAE